MNNEDMTKALLDYYGNTIPKYDPYVSSNPTLYNPNIIRYHLSLIDIKDRDRNYETWIKNANSYREKRFYERKRARNLLDRGLKYPRLYSYDSIYGGG